MIPPCFTCRLAALALSLASLVVQGQAQVTTRKDEVGKWLNEWYAAGTAAGLAALTYENRDGGHSLLPAGRYPQLQTFQPDEKSGPPTGPAMMLRRQPTVGNCSMSAPVDKGGSLPRLYQMDPKGHAFLMMQYLANNLFIYPEHQDHDPGSNGLGGYGDVYPANSACQLISQGSSGSDQPLLDAVLATVAAFPPQTQALLIEKRVLMPTLQAILRQSRRQVLSDDDYLSGKAHPVVFDAASLNEEKMVRSAHEMRPPMIPPVVQLEVLEETEPVAGKDYFEVENAHPWRMGDTPVAIARLLRAGRSGHSMRLSARKSADLLGRPIRFFWKLLQGDPARVRIEAAENEPSARIHVDWQPPTLSESGIRSHRVDIGVFASNGISTSAPAMVTFFILPNEFHFHDDQGRIREMSYLEHNPDLGLPADDGDARWLDILLAVARPGQDLAGRLLKPLVSEAERTALDSLAGPLEIRAREIHQMTASQPPVLPEELEARRAALKEKLTAVLNQPFPEKGAPALRERLRGVFTKMAAFADLYPSFQTLLQAMAARSPKPEASAEVSREVRRLVDLGILIEGKGGWVTTATPVENLSPAERHYLAGLNLTVLSQVLFPGLLERSSLPSWVDPRLTTPKAWRDVHHYGPDGSHLGWQRHHLGKVHQFNSEGQFLPEGPGKPEAALPVIYEKNAQGGLEWRPK